MTGREDVHFVLLEFPAEEEGGEDEASWVKGYQDKIESICNEYCFQLGALYVLPRTYLVLVEEMLQKAEVEYHARGYNPLLKIIHFNLRWEEYRELLSTVIGRVQSRLENYLKILEEKEHSEKLAQTIFKEVVKARELTLIFQLERFLPKETMKLQDLTGILNERIMELKLSVRQQVEVMEL